MCIRDSYQDIGDYLSRVEKLKLIQGFGSFKGIKCKKITPNSSNDWINQRDPTFNRFIPLVGKDGEEQGIFDICSNGILTSRDPWVYNFSRKYLADNLKRMIDFYNLQAEEYRTSCKGLSKDQRPQIDSVIDNNPQKISWSSSLKILLSRLLFLKFDNHQITEGMYRPFSKQWFYFDNRLNHRVSQMPKMLPLESASNIVICVSGIAASKEFSALVTDIAPNFHMHDTGQCFSLYTYESQDNTGSLFSGKEGTGSRRQENIPDSVLEEFRKIYRGKAISKEDIFYYVYGILHSLEYKRRFESDLKKMLPRIPFAQDFWAFSKAGRELAQWHLNYETVEPYPLQEHSDKLGFDSKDHHHVTKMIFGKKDRKEDKTTIIYNSHITLSGIPLEAYDYVCLLYTSPSPRD